MPLAGDSEASGGVPTAERVRMPRTRSAPDGVSGALVKRLS